MESVGTLQPTHMVLSSGFYVPMNVVNNIHGLGVTNVIDIFIGELGIKHGEYSLR